jgi:hypothetical protein
MTKNEQYDEYGVFVGAKVTMKKDRTIEGIVKHIDENLMNVSTCNVCWTLWGGKVFQDSDNQEDWDIQWTNKLEVIE